MCEALRDLMKEEIQEERQDAVDIETVVMIKNLMKKQGWDDTKTMDNMGIPPADQIRYAARL